MSSSESVITTFAVVSPDIIENEADVVETSRNDNTSKDCINQRVDEVFDALSVSTVTETSSFNDDNLYTLENHGNSVQNPATSDRSSGSVGHVAIETSSDISFGNKTFFNGPVVIKRFVVDNDNLSADQHQYTDKPEVSENKTTRTTNRCSKEYCRRHKAVFIFIIITIVVMITTFVTGYVLIRQHHLDNNSMSPTVMSVSLGPIDEDYEYITRSQYGARPPKMPPELLTLPVKRIIIAHTDTGNCTNLVECGARIRSIQSNHMNSNGWDDIGLNFLVGGDGRAYQGCDYTVGAHTCNFNAGSICISFIGNFNFTKVPAKQLRAAQRFIEDGIKSQQIHPNYALYGQKQLKATASPGDELYKEIVLWKGWSADIIPL